MVLKIKFEQTAEQIAFHSWIIVSLNQTSRSEITQSESLIIYFNLGSYTILFSEDHSKT